MQQAQGDGEEAPQGRQQIAPLPALDHDDIAYPPFAKDFYTPVHKIASMTPGEVNCHSNECYPALWSSVVLGGRECVCVWGGGVGGGGGGVDLLVRAEAGSVTGLPKWKTVGGGEH